MVFKMQLLPFLAQIFAILTTNITIESKITMYSREFQKSPEGNLAKYNSEINNDIQPDKEICQVEGQTYYCRKNGKAGIQRNEHEKRCNSHEFRQDENTLEVIQKIGSEFQYPDRDCFKFYLPRHDGEGMYLNVDWKSSSHNDNPEYGTMALLRNRETTAGVKKWMVHDGILKGLKKFPGGPFCSKNRLCNCRDDVCYCCVGTSFTLPTISNHNICMKWNLNENAIIVDINLNGELMYQKITIGENSNTVCVTPFWTPFEKICVALVEPFLFEKVLYACIEVYGLYNQVPIFHEQIDCIHLGPYDFLNAIPGAYDGIPAVEYANQTIKMMVKDFGVGEEDDAGAPGNFQKKALFLTPVKRVKYLILN